MAGCSKRSRFTSLKADFGSDIVQNSLESFISKSADCKSVDLGSSPLRDACTRREGLDLAQTPSFSPLFSSSPLKLNDALSKTLSSQGSCDLHDIQFFTTPPLSPSISSVSTFGTTNVLDALSDNPSFPSMTDSSETMTDELSVRETESYLPLSEDDTVIALNWLDLL